MPNDIFVIGTDLYEQNLIDKKVDVIFCNPPHSDFKSWMLKIIKEANCRIIYMVKDIQEINSILKTRIDLKERVAHVLNEEATRNVLF